MNEIIYRGLGLTSQRGCRYFKVVEGSICSFVEDTKTSTATLTYTPGSTSETLSKLLGLKLYDDQSMESTPGDRAIRYSNVTLSLNGLVLKKLTADTHIFNLIIVNDSESRVVQTYDNTTIVVSSEDADNENFVNFLFYSGGLQYLTPVGPKPKCWRFVNFPKILIKDTNIELESTSTTRYNLRRRYDDYLIRAIDYQDQFVAEVRRILESYGIELVRWNKEETLKVTSYISYRFDQTPTKVHHPGYSDDTETVMQHKVPIEFTLRTPDMVMYFDFKNKYNNLDILTNFCEFKTTDRYGERWTAAVKWGGITEDFNHLYQQDDNSNFSFQCQFRCELFFYEVLDTRYKFLEEIENLIELGEKGVKEKDPIKETQIVR